MKKAQINQVFVYILSIIIILFVGFLVVKFISAFLNDTEDISELKFLNLLEEDYNKIYETLGAEEVLEYKVSQKVNEICFVAELSCIDSLGLELNKLESLNTTVIAGDNVVVFDNDDIILSKEIGDFSTPNGCFCIEPLNTRFELVIENDRNKIEIIPN